MKNLQTIAFFGEYLSEHLDAEVDLSTVLMLELGDTEREIGASSARNTLRTLCNVLIASYSVLLT